jgi:3-oxoacyl-[acyl-carrier protein] reductase
MDLGLTGKVAMVAGASRGLGYAGAASRIAAETSADTLATGVDVRSADAIVAWHQATVERFGGVDLLVVNAGGPPAGASLGFDDAAWQGAFELLVLLTCTRT